MKKYILSFFLALTGVANAQDPVFTQSLLVPETLNPNFSGYLDSWNAGGIHRIQWPNETRELNTSLFFIGLRPKFTEKIGLKFSVLRHHEVFTDYKFHQMNLAASYKIALNENTLSFGLEGGYGTKNFDFGGLLLEDQINVNDGSINPVSGDPFLNNSSGQVHFFDVSAGVLFNTENSWIGLTVKHLNTPNISFSGEGNVPLDIFASLHGKYVANDEMLSFLPADSNLFFGFNFIKQSEYNRLDIGSGMVFNNKVTLGTMAVLNPMRKAENSHLLTSLNPFANFIFMAGKSDRNNQLKIGASYDINTTKFGNNKGVYEFTLTWLYNLDCKQCYNLDNFSMP